MKQEEGSSSWLSEQAKLAAEFFVGGIGLLYATGFLTTFTFFERFGLREMGGDFFRLKYIYVGILYFLFPVTLAMPLFALLLLYKRVKDLRKTQPESKALPDPLDGTGRIQRNLLRIPIPSVLLFLNMVFVFYLVVMFAPPGFVRKREWIIATLLIGTVLGLLACRWLEDSKATTGWFGNKGTTLRWILFALVVVWIDRKAIHGLSADLNRMFFGQAGVFYYLIVTLCVAVAYRVCIRVYQHTTSAIRVPYLVLGMGILASLFFYSILAFANRVYPFVFANKGGGDFRKSGSVVVHFVKDSDSSIPGNIMDRNRGSLTSLPLILIEQTGLAVYVALPGNEDGWRMGKSLPDVYSVSVTQIAAVEYLPR